MCNYAKNTFRRVAAHLYHPKGGGDDEKGGGFGSGRVDLVHRPYGVDTGRSKGDLETRKLFIGREAYQKAYYDEERSCIRVKLHLGWTYWYH